MEKKRKKRKKCADIHTSEQDRREQAASKTEEISNISP